MTEQQIPKLVAAFVEHQSEFFTKLTNDDAQWVITNTKEAIALACCAIRNRVVKPTTQAIVDIIHAVGEVTFPGATKFVAKDHFIVDTSETAKVKISGLGSNFTRLCLDKVETNVAPSKVGYGKLLRRVKDAIIIAFLGGEIKSETSFAEIFHLMSLQGNREVGALLTNGWANIFYAKDSSGVLRSVYVYWDGDGWYVNASLVANSDEWRDGDRVFSRKVA